MSLLARLVYAWSAFFRIVFDRSFAERVRAAASAPALEAPRAAEPAPRPEPRASTPSRPPADAALWLLGLLQREGRFVDFVEQDVEAFSDADVGAAARVVHDGCRKALRAHVTLAPVREEAEGTAVTLEAGFDPGAIKLTGSVGGSPPHRGTLRHRGWRAADLELPELVAGHDASILAPAEVEL